MKIDKALAEMICGTKMRRTDWNWSVNAYIEIIVHNHTKQFFITGQINNEPDFQQLYGMTYMDLTSGTWVIVDR